MNHRKNKVIAIWILMAVLASSFPSGFVMAASETESAITSYSKGPLYVFSEGKGAAEQLEDIFTTIDLQSATIEDLKREMEEGKLTSEMLTRMYLDRIEAYDRSGDLNSVIWINENAIEEAKALDRERAQGKVRGKLHGIPIIVKDNYNVEGMPTAAGSVALADLMAKEDAGTVKKLKEAGALIIGKANMSEFAFSAVDSQSTLGGDAHNAYDNKRSAAGSSGGTATAVRSNFAAAGLGTDTGGSIRNPSSWSGLFGIRPSKGLTSIGGVIPLMAARDTTGPMAKTAEDLSIVLEAMAGCDENDDYTLEAKGDELLGEGYSKDLSEASLKGKRIAFLSSSFDYKSLSVNKLNEVVEKHRSEFTDGLRTMFSEPFTEKDIYPSQSLTTEVNALTRRARADMRKAGAEFVDLSGFISDEETTIFKFYNGASTMEYDVNVFLDRYAGDYRIKTFKDILKTGENVGYMSFLKEGLEQPQDISIYKDIFVKEDYGEYGYIKYGDEGYLRPDDWRLVLKERKRISQILEDNDIDAIMYVYFESPAFLNNSFSMIRNPSPYERAFGPALGFPDINIPIGFATPIDGETDKKFPLGIGLIGRYGGEKELLEIAAAYEREAGASIRKEPESTPALRDERLNSFLDALMEKACSLDPGKYGGSVASGYRKLQYAYNKALSADYSDPYSVYNAASELSEAYDRVIQWNNEKRKAAGTVLIKGQKIKDIGAAVFTGVNNITGFSSDDKKTVTVSKKGVLKGKKPGRTVIKALDNRDKKNPVTLSSCRVTVLDKPAIEFEEVPLSGNEGKVIDPYDFLISPDYDLLSPDKWDSSRSNVAEIDAETGRVIIKGKGKTKITAYFGNVKVKGVLKVG